MRKITKMIDEYHSGWNRSDEYPVDWENKNADIERDNLQTKEMDIEKFKKIINNMNEEQLNNSRIEFYNNNTDETLHVDSILLENGRFTIYLR